MLTTSFLQENVIQKQNLQHIKNSYFLVMRIVLQQRFTKTYEGMEVNCHAISTSKKQLRAEVKVCFHTTRNSSLTYSQVAPVHAIKAYAKVEVKRLSFLPSTLDGYKWSTSRSVRFVGTERRRYPISRKPGGTQNRSGLFGEDKNIFPPPGIEPLFSDVLDVYHWNYYYYILLR